MFHPVSGGVAGYFGLCVETLPGAALPVGPGDPRLVFAAAADHPVVVAKSHRLGGTFERQPPTPGVGHDATWQHAAQAAGGAQWLGSTFCKAMQSPFSRR